jgi:hypothetical protein
VPSPTVDYAALADSLGLRGVCVLHEYRPEVRKIERPASCSDGALTVALSETVGPWSDSPPRPILTITHRATVLCLNSVAGPYPTTLAGLRQAKATTKVLRAAPGFDWASETPTPVNLPPADCVTALRDLVGDLGTPTRKPSRSRRVIASSS